jgi:hypothetical protein
MDDKREGIRVAGVGGGQGARVAPRWKMVVATLLRLAIPYHERAWAREGQSVAARDGAAGDLSDAATPCGGRAV